MADIVDRITRSRMMARVKSKNTKPEILIRKRLHARGFRYRLHQASLPGKPDLVFPKYGAVILVNGCFWHGHDCHLFKIPSTRTDFWKNKITSTRRNDRKVLERLSSEGWRICIVWECALRGKGKDPVSVVENIASWLSGNEAFLEIKG